MNQPRPQVQPDTEQTEKRKVECYKCQWPHLGGCGTPLCPNWEPKDQ